MNNSRVNKYRDLRAGLKDEAGINRENNIEETVNRVDDIEEDDFLAKINRSFKDGVKTGHDINDTLTEAKTFEQMRQESSEEINRALRSAKVSVGKEAQYNTRMDILNKIREPEKQVIRIDNLDNINTSEFSKGYFINKEESVEVKNDDENKMAKKKMTLMERLASMSPEEDAKKARLVMEEAEVKQTNPGETTEEKSDESKDFNQKAKIEQTRSLEEMLRQIKEKDQREVEKALKQKEETADLKMIKKQVDDKTTDSKLENDELRSDIIDDNKSNRIANILNYVIIFLVVVFLGLCGMIGYQLFF